jgi:hypothetical protein
MHVQQTIFEHNQWKSLSTETTDEAAKAQLALIFGAKKQVADEELRAQLRVRYPLADLVFASTAGEIVNDQVVDNTLCVNAITFAQTPTRCVLTHIDQHRNSFETGKYLFQALYAEDLNSIFVLCDGTLVNGSDLVAGLNDSNTSGITISGGLAGDGGQFLGTLVGLNEELGTGNALAVGFYGKALQVYHSSLGGWDEFGRDRLITKSKKNVLFEIDGRKALDLYKEYLGPFSAELPSSAFLFPISIKTPESEQKLVRTILYINEDNGSMIFAGNMPEGATIRLMKANFDKLTEASADSARQVISQAGKLDLAILISCIGRRLVLQTRTEEEIWAARSILGKETAIAGFYSYGELSPYNPSGRCELHNQTMTITGFYEH